MRGKAKKKLFYYFAINKLVVYLHTILRQDPAKGGEKFFERVKMNFF